MSERQQVDGAGLVFGTLIGVAVWVVIIGAYMAVRHYILK